MLVNCIISFGWGCSCLSCTNRAVGATVGGAAVSAAPTEPLGYCLVGALETSAPPGLLHEQFLYLTVGCAHDVDATLEVLYAYSAEVIYLDVGVVVGSG